LKWDGKNKSNHEENSFKALMFLYSTCTHVGVRADRVASHFFFPYGIAKE
jgi:hypothetical protein